MINLVRNELTKIFSKKAIYIILLISLAFVVLTNYIYKKYNNNEPYFYDETTYIEDLKKEQETIDLKKSENLDWYVNNATAIDIYELKSKYGVDSWQYAVTDQTELYDIIYQINYLTYGKYKDKAALKKYQSKYDKIIAKFDNGDWKSFVEDEITELNKTLKEQNKVLKKAQGTTEISAAELAIFNTELEIEINNMRLEKDIPYGNDYLNNALNTYKNSKSSWNVNKDKELTYEEELELKENLKAMTIAKYTIDNKYNDGETSDMRSIYKSFFNEYQILIIVIIVMTSGVIVSEEFNKGTIKQLLIRPYGRIKILLSKYITCLIMVGFAVLALFILQSVVGLITFGPSSLRIPVANYDYVTNSVVTQNVFKYLLTILIAKVPIFILLGTLAFALSAIFGVSALAIAITLIGSFISDIINMLAIGYDVKFMKYFVTLNWDFTQYLFGKAPEFKYLTMNFSIIVCIAYLVIMLVTTFIIFKHKNIKNI